MHMIYIFTCRSVSTSPDALDLSGKNGKIFIFQCFPQIPGRASQIHFWQSVAAPMSLMHVWISWMEFKWPQSAIAWLISFWQLSSSVMLQLVLSTGLAVAKAARQAKASRAKDVFILMLAQTFGGDPH